MRRILLILEFHGAAFFGWQRQGVSRSVQATVEEAVRDLVRHDVNVQSSGRTDRGVHALAMPAHVDVDTRLDCESIMMALNARLPDDCKVRRVHEMDPRFHARFDAVRKLYRYSLVQSRAPSPLLADRAHHFPRKLDVAAMNEAATLLVGERDFACFRVNPDDEPEDGPAITADAFGPARHLPPPPWRKPRPVGTVRNLTALRVKQLGRIIQIEAEANGFLRGMVRALAGTLTQVGLGKQKPAWVQRVQQSLDRREAGANLPAHGLTLVKVTYPGEAFINCRP
ncbi:MAG: tRNA pseudouridine synthase A [Planctomycetes bacterium]|nr:tRNA pseudouridine synthase A [Planctomycetota bacterium]